MMNCVIHHVLDQRVIHNTDSLTEVKVWLINIVKQIISPYTLLLHWSCSVATQAQCDCVELFDCKAELLKINIY